ncbi:MAG: TonB-dependent receptor [Polyangiaceae bacterium]
MTRLHPWLFAFLTGLMALPARAQDPADAPDEAPGKDPAATSKITGRVTDALSGASLAEVQIEVVGKPISTVTDAQGNFELRLAPGSYNLRLSSPGYGAMRVRKVVLWAGAARRIDVTLEPDETAADDFVVEAAPDTSSLDALALERKRSSAVGDSVGRAEISKTPDRDAAQAAKRVVGATIEGNRFVYVRGLGERYTNALINGAPLPSPEPDRAAVPLDLFPTQVLESLTIAKTFTPDMPGDFAGGSVRVETRRVPEKFTFNASASLGFNTETTFRERLSHRGGKLDFLGVDDGTRALPDSIPGDYLLAQGVEKPNGDFVLDPELTARGQDLNTYMSGVRSFTLPTHSFSVVAGNGFKLGGDKRLGYIASLNYRRGYKIRSEKRRVFEPDANSDSGLTTVNDLDVETGSEDVSWGALAGASFELSKQHRVGALAFHSQLADIDTQTFDGYWRRNDATLHSTRLKFVSRALNVVQLTGQSTFDAKSRGTLDYNLSYSVAQRDEPDTRDIVYQKNPQTGVFSYVDGSESGRHFFSSQSEKAYAAGLDFTQPLSSDEDASKVKLGGLVNLKDREFSARRFAFRRIPGTPPDRFTCPGTSYDESCPDSLFVPENIGTALRLQESTRPEDAYQANLDVYAVYMMADARVAKDLRLVLGERLEVTRQAIDPVDQFDTGAAVPGADLASTDLLPSASLAYDVTKKSKLRFAVTRTLARPQLRELAPFAYSDFFGGRLTSGNPDLELTRIINADMRFEYFPRLSEVLAFSVFFKRFADPIEPVATPSGDGGLVTFQNAKAANLIGVEVESRVGLRYLTQALQDFSFVANLTLARSRIEVEQTDRDFLTHTSRPMVNQAPYVLNVALDYQHEPLGLNGRVLYNIQGKRIVEVGSDGLDDAYEHPRHSLDVVLAKDLGSHFQLKASATNLIDPERIVTIGPDKRDDRVTSRYRDGRSFTLGASYKY